ncbi:hypothetical protein Rleg4DRAFT_5982 [Rhizobium leguminosarum bv. trifolii WSM2297]|uniref:Abasic site processing protein n=1 Tax=Rhizobium leguminosarum bv. trifolii WSM2297 TaxID=754762 RepID=J0WFM1_RHILT|nr:SOS response-associated peptidase [Rhizobium leguminosarum]EJC84183.1 hypothetical protein Rleg4DRAFT_5982 [Rhizobium leguminosarum bv. trifolii WSM2297]
MCRRIYIDQPFDEMARNFAFAERGDVDDLGDRLPRYNGGALEVYHIVIQDVERQRDLRRPVFAVARWGLTPAWMDRPRRQPPVHARREEINSNGLFQEAYRSRRCLIPLSGFFEWRDSLGTSRNEQPYAVAMKDQSIFALAGIWEAWHHPIGIDIRSFAVVTCPPNEMMATIQNRMPVIIRREDYEHWLSPDPDPRDLMKPFNAEAMMMWPIARRVKTVRNPGAGVIDQIDPAPNGFCN